MMLPRFTDKGSMTLNGPVVEGHACRVRLYVGPGVVMGADVLIVATDPQTAQGVAKFIDEQASAPMHVLIGQAPWYQNENRGHTLEDELKAAR